MSADSNRGSVLLSERDERGGRSSRSESGKFSTYAYAMCNSCGWRREATPELSAEELLASHPRECPSAERYLRVAMWSVAWPYYHSEASVAWRAGGHIPPFGLEMAWRVPGSHSTRSPSQFDHGGMAKEWYLFA